MFKDCIALHEAATTGYGLLWLQSGLCSCAVRSLNFHLHYASMMLLLIRLTTRDVWQPWLQPQAAKRVAGTLNYFLKFLTGSHPANVAPSP